MQLPHFLSDALQLLFPRCCTICNQRLLPEENYLCASCLISLPRTGFRGKKDNIVERIFWGKIPIERANAYLYYHPGADSCKPILALKYYQRRDLGIYLGRLIANDLIGTDFFDGIDWLVPLPLAHRRQRQRGYNQSQLLAEGVAAITGIALLTHAVERSVDNSSQTRLAPEERQENVKNIFRVTRPNLLQGKHILLIDDVLTTGATLLSCAETIAHSADVRISILTLCLAGTHHYPAINFK